MLVQSFLQIKIYFNPGVLWIECLGPVMEKIDDLVSLKLIRSETDVATLVGLSLNFSCRILDIKVGNQIYTRCEIHK